MSVWRRGSLTENPYVENAFRVARVSPEVVRRHTLVQLIGQARMIVSTDARAHSIRGQAVTSEDINRAESILLAPQERILEELLVHATERLPLQRARQLMQEASAVLVREAAAPAQVRDLQVLRTWVADLVGQYLDGVKPSDAGFGALEMDLVPPFGRNERQ